MTKCGTAMRRNGLTLLLKARLALPLLLRFPLAAALLAAGAAQAAPATWLWAWDRPEDLRWIPPGVGVAYFAAELQIYGEHIRSTRRQAVLRLPPDTPRRPVIHVEAFDRHRPALLDEAAAERWAAALYQAITQLGAGEVQIDFEARAAQRSFYRQVLHTLRAQLPADYRISITALASWCGDAAWLQTLPVDEIVPMFFRLGPAERTLWQARMRAPERLPAPCRTSAGLATDEWNSLAGGEAGAALASFDDRTLYLFSPRAWRAGTLSALPGWTQRQAAAAPSR